MAELPLRVTLQDQTQAGLSRLNQNLGQSSQQLGGMASLGRTVGPAIAGGVAAAGAALVSLVGNTIESSKEIDNLAEVSQLTTADLQVFAQIAERSGGSIEDVADAAREMQLRLAEAASLGTGPAVDALNLLGIELESLQSLRPEEQFRLLRDAISAVEDPAHRVFAAEELLGGSSERLAEFVGLSASAFREQAEAIEASGAVMSEQAIANSVAAGEAIDDLLASVQGIAGEFAAGLTPAIETGANALSTLLRQTQESNAAEVERIENLRFLNEATEIATQKTLQLSFGTVALRGQYEDLEEVADQLRATEEAQVEVYSRLVAVRAGNINALEAETGATQRLTLAASALNQVYAGGANRRRGIRGAINPGQRGSFRGAAGGAQFNRQSVDRGPSAFATVGDFIGGGSFNPGDFFAPVGVRAAGGGGPGDLGGTVVVNVELEGDPIARVVQDRLDTGAITVRPGTLG